MAASFVPQEKLNLLLLGKTGSGISSSGNSILDQDSFVTTNSSVSCTKQIAVGNARRFNHNITVVDTPGLFVTSTSNNLRRSAVKEIDNLSQSFKHCPDGFHALVLVFNYPTKMTEEERKTIERLTEIFGPNFIKDHVVIIVTNGENFDILGRRNPQSFTSWCENQTGRFGFLYNECKKRAVLFYNESTKDKKDQAVQKLISTVSGICNPYTKAMFEKQSSCHKTIVVTSDQAQVTGKFEPKIDEVKKILNELESSTARHKNVIRRARNLKAQAQYLNKELENEDGGTGVFKDLKEEVQKQLTSIDNLISKHEEQLKYPRSYISALFA